MAERFADKAALVIGGSSGIGLAVATGLLAEGARVAIAARGEDRLQAAASTLVERFSAARVLALPGDVAAAPEAERLVRATAEHFGGLDILVTAAARNYTSLIGEAQPADIENVFRTNALGPLYAARAASAVLPSGGRIVTLSATAARRGRPGRAVYAACKGAVEAMTRVLAVELAPRGITVNAVAPGLTDTPMLEDEHKQDPARLRAIPMGRLGQPAEVAAAVLFLVSADAGWVTGQVVDATGGYGL